MTVKEAEFRAHIPRRKNLAKITIPQISLLKKKSYQLYTILVNGGRGVFPRSSYETGSRGSFFSERF